MQEFDFLIVTDMTEVRLKCQPLNLPRLTTASEVYVVHKGVEVYVGVYRDLSFINVSLIHSFLQREDVLDILDAFYITSTKRDSLNAFRTACETADEIVAKLKDTLNMPECYLHPALPNALISLAALSKTITDHIDDNPDLFTSLKIITDFAKGEPPNKRD